MVKLQKHKAYTYEADNGERIEHYKHTVVIPENMIEKVGWKDGMELAVVPRNNSITLKPEEEEEE
jgi:hypothetical protein